MERWGRTPVRSADAPGFIVNRVNRPFTLEPLAALEARRGDGRRRSTGAIRAAGYPMGPFELMDLIGLDVNLAVSTRAPRRGGRGRAIPSRTGSGRRPSRRGSSRAGRLGRKTGGGLLPLRRRRRRIAALPRPAPTTADDPAAAVVERIELAIVDEAYRALGDGVATAADIDLALRLGAGHPIGPFERVDAMGGPAVVLARLRRSPIAARASPRRPRSLGAASR